MEKWEYKVVELVQYEDIDLNKYGSDGWELIQILPITILRSDECSPDMYKYSSHAYYFKRKLQ